jgi:hypothetical protein
VRATVALGRARVLTSKFDADNHDMPARTIPGISKTYSCDFDKYIELDNYAVATVVVIGSLYYLDDERNNNYPKQDEVDPLADRLQMYLNANDCTLDWLDQSAAKASASGKRVLFIMLHAKFYADNGKTPLGNNGIGEYYNTQNLESLTEGFSGTKISKLYEPLFTKLTETALA